MNYKPDGYPSVLPYLIVSGANETIQFLTQAFGATEIRRFPGETGKLMHSEVRLDDRILIIADCAPDWPALPVKILASTLMLNVFIGTA